MDTELLLQGISNEKLDALAKAFESCGGEVHIGDAAWSHLEELAGSTMSRFIDGYIRAPIQDLLVRGVDRMPDLIARETRGAIELTVGADTLTITREARESRLAETSDSLPADSDDELYDV